MLTGSSGNSGPELFEVLQNHVPVSRKGLPMSPCVSSVARLILAAFVSLAWCGQVGAIELIGDYRLGLGTLNNFATGTGSLGSLTITQNGGTAGFGPNGWSWSDATTPGSGLNLANLPENSTTSYSIGITALFGETSGFRKVIDFKSQTSDTGFYVHNNAFQFFNTTQDFGSVNDFQEFTVVLTRDADKIVNLYVNGESTPLLSFTDTDDFAVASDGLLKFFQDDTVTSGEFSTLGTASLIRIWDQPLAPAQIASAMIVPEPSAWMLGTVALTVILMAARRRAAGN